MKQLIIQKNFHLNIIDNYTCIDNQTVLFVAKGTWLSHKLNFTIVDHDKQSLATIRNRYESKQYRNVLQLSSGAEYTLEKIKKKERHNEHHLFTVYIHDIPVRVEHLQSNYSFAIIMDGHTIATIERKVMKLTTTFHVKYDEYALQKDAELLLFFMTIILDKRKMVLFDNVSDFLL